MESLSFYENQFIKATEILPSRPLNELDYRKLFIDVGLKSGSSRAVKNSVTIKKGIKYVKENFKS